ncbi:hypothetical protein NKH84_32110 [Mesorhizobium sp. M0902]|uniref:hypothetical protein n=1 Tax=unclassified Mesorhizobium TaxID=325217 RepID=UPI0033375A71
MADTQPNDDRPKKDRSPSFPFISLPEAVKRLQAFEQTFGRHAAPGVKVGLAWGMKDRSSQAYQILAALKAFGLVRYEGSGKDLKATLTDDARIYLRANMEMTKKELLKQLALKPAQLQKFWGIWGADRPPDPVCLDQLILQHAFTDNAAHTFLKVYDDTVAYAGLSNAYAGLSNSDTVIGDDVEDAEPPLEFKVGDLVNWDSGGQVQWKAPRRIVSIDEKDGLFFYKVDGLGELAGQIGWIPVEQAIQRQAAAPAGSNQFTPPPADPKKDDVVIQGTRKAVFPVTGGDVTMIFPEGLSKDGLEELGQYLDIFLKKEKKTVGS